MRNGYYFATTNDDSDTEFVTLVVPAQRFSVTELVFCFTLTFPQMVDRTMVILMTTKMMIK